MVTFVIRLPTIGFPVESPFFRSPLVLFDNLASYCLVVNHRKRIKSSFISCERRTNVSSPASPPRIDPPLLSQILGQGAMASPLIALKGPLMNKRDYSVTFALKHALKDMHFALDLGVKVRNPPRRDGHHVTCASVLVILSGSSGKSLVSSRKGCVRFSYVQ